MSDPTAVGLIVCVPLLAKAPDQLPEAVQPVALADDQVMVVEPPVTIDVDARLSVGAAGVTTAVTDSITEVAGEVPATFEQTSV